MSIKGGFSAYFNQIVQFIHHFVEQLLLIPNKYTIVYVDREITIMDH
jgi:hypothetical protein